MISRLAGLIKPFDPARIVNCSYELSMGSEAHITGRDSRTKLKIADLEQISIPPGQFAQLLTEESIEVPNDALGLISIKSGLKSRGLVNVSGFHVDPGFSGRLLFSVYNAGPNNIVLSQGSRSFLIWYASLDSPTSDLYNGASANLQSISDDQVMKLQGEVFTPQALADRILNIESRLKTYAWLCSTTLAALISVLVTVALR